MRELLAAESVPCCSLIPMSELPSMRHFSSYDLIPIPPDEADNQVHTIMHVDFKILQ